LKRGEVADVIIVADNVMKGFIKDGLVLADSYKPLVRSSVGMAVREGAEKPNISTLQAFKETLLRATSIAFSASVSGQHLTNEVYQRLGIADQVMEKCSLIGGGERVGTVVARGDAEIGFQQMSELMPVPGIAYITPLPMELQKISIFSAGVARTSTDPEMAKKVIEFLSSEQARTTITKSGLEPIPN
jgi:molybdate transport system substrate-binding protein